MALKIFIIVWASLLFSSSIIKNTLDANRRIRRIKFRKENDGKEPSESIEVLNASLNSTLFAGGIQILTFMIILYLFIEYRDEINIIADFVWNEIL